MSVPPAECVVDPGVTPYHAIHHALTLTATGPAKDVAQVGAGLFDARVDLNPHQIEAAQFGIAASVEEGRLLADEVGLGKTIEAGLLLCQRWAERKRRLLVICPASLRGQWKAELESKFGLPAVLLTRKDDAIEGSSPTVVVVSYAFAVRNAERLDAVDWDLVVCDEAHRMRNCWKSSSRIGRSLVPLLRRSPRILLTATPLQNSLLELYGLTSILDPAIFGEIDDFRRTWTRGRVDLEALRERLRPVLKRTLRRQVLPYIRYTKRSAHTEPFEASAEEQRLHELVREYVARDDNNAMRPQQAVFIGLMLSKLVASSTAAIASALGTIHARLLRSRDERAELEIEPEDLDEDAVDEDWSDEDDLLSPSVVGDLDRPLRPLNEELAELASMIALAQRVPTDRRSAALISALTICRPKLREVGAADKAVVFTESRRTMDRLRLYLEANGYADRVLCYHGGKLQDASRVVPDWQVRNPDFARQCAPAVQARMAVLDAFERDGTILIATEAGAEGLNLQFCSLVVNYDLPWNPQRVEQRIGRCHRYGQKHDVLVVNLVDTSNLADLRVLELLQDKLRLFDGIFGSSDAVLGQLNGGGVGFERRLFDIVRTCRTRDAIEAAFDRLREELKDEIAEHEAKARKTLLDAFDTEVGERLRVGKERATLFLDRQTRLFWALLRWALRDRALFDDERLMVDVQEPPDSLPSGHYRMVRTATDETPPAFVLRLTHRLGEWALREGASAACERGLAERAALIEFDLAAGGRKFSVLEPLAGRSGWLCVERVALEGMEREVHVIVSGFVARGESGQGNGEANQAAASGEVEDLAPEVVAKLFELSGEVIGDREVPVETRDRIEASAQASFSARVEAFVRGDREAYDAALTRIERRERDGVAAAEAEIGDRRKVLRDLDRKARTAETPAEQVEAAAKVRQAQSTLQQARRALFAREDELRQERLTFEEKLRSRALRKTQRERVFVVAWGMRRSPSA